MVTVTLYTRTGCHLCEEAKKVLQEARAEIEFELEEVDIDQFPELVARYNDEVPVIFINGRKAFKYRVDRRDLLRRLKDW